MKVSVADLKSALDWITANSKTLQISITPSENYLDLGLFDEQDSIVRIRLFALDDKGNGLMMPKITRTETL